MSFSKANIPVTIGFILSFFLTTKIGIAQDELPPADHCFYMRTGFNTGNYNVGFNMDLNYIYKNKYTAQIGYSGFFKHPDSAPEDYSIGLATLFSFGLARVYDQVHNYNFLIGHLIPLNKKESLRLHFRAGAAYSRRLVPINWVGVNTLGFTENYDYDYIQKTGAALILNLELQWAYLNFLGHSFDTVLMIREDVVYVGFGISGSLGLLR